MNKLVVAAFSVFLLGQAVGQDTPDPTFSGDGIFMHDFGFQDNLMDVKVQSDGTIISCGTAINPSFSGQLLVMRQSAGGGFDTGFNNQGYFILNDYLESYAYQVIEKTDGKLLVAGAFADSNYIFSTLLLRFNSNGTLDNTFGNAGIVEIDVAPGVDDFAYAMVEQPDHKIILAGTALDTSFRHVPYIMRVNEDGSPDNLFGTSGITYVPVNEADNRFNGLALQADGKILAAGHIGNPLTQSGQFDFDALVVRLNDNGSYDNTFDGDGIVTDAISAEYVDQLFGIAATDSGSVIVGGFTTLPDFSYDLIAIHYNEDGSRNDNFGSNGLFTFHNAAQDVAYDLAIDAQGKILIAGTSGGFSFDNRDLLLIRLDANGTPDLSFGTSGIVLTEILQQFDEANAMAIQGDGKIILAGKANNGSNNDACVVRYSNQLAVSSVSAGELSVCPNPVSSGQIITISAPESFSNQISNWSLTTVSGAQISKGTLVLSANSSIELPAVLAAGTYLLHINGFVTRVVIH